MQWASIRNRVSKDLQHLEASHDDFSFADRPAELLSSMITPADGLEAETMELARHIAKASLSCLAAGKQAFYSQVNLPDAAAYDLASNVIVNNFFTEDGKEGVAAFLEKRKPVWKDR